MDVPPWALVKVVATIVILSPGPLTMMLLAYAALGRGGAAIPLLIGGALAYAAIWGAAAAFSRHIAGVEPCCSKCFNGSVSHLSCGLRG